MQKAIRIFGVILFTLLILAGGFIGYKYLTLSAILGSEPSVTNDCKQIFFMSGRTGSNQLFHLNIGDNQVTQLTSDNSAKHYPVISPDQQRVAFSQKVAGDWWISVFNLSDNEINQVVQTRTFNPMRPSWLGNSILVYSSEKSGNREIHQIDLTTEEETNLSNHPGLDDHPFAISEQELIIFSSERDGNKEIYTMGIDGSNQKRLTNNDYYDGFPSASGSCITYLSRNGNERMIMSMQIDGSSPTTTKSFNSEAYYPIACRSCEEIFFVQDIDQEMSLYRLKISSNEITKLVLD